MATKTVAREVSAGEAAQCERLIKELVTKMDRARRQMRRDQAEINRLKAKTRATLAELKAMK